MIFVTVGKEKFPFDRLIKIIDEFVKAGEVSGRVFAQTGSSGYIPKVLEYKRSLGFMEQVKFLEEADIIISHAGEGTILLCEHLGKIPIVFPRRSVLGEHIDDHQVELTQKMSDRSNVLIARTEEELIDMIKNYKTYIAGLKRQDNVLDRKYIVEYLKKICGI